MVAGTGTFVLSQKDAAGGAAPPFAANSAVNGLSVNGAGQIVLGDDVGGALAQLLSNRVIDQNGFSFQMFDGLDRIFDLDPLNGQYSIGNISGGGGGTYLYIDDPNQSVSIASNLGEMLALDNANGGYRIGDVTGAGNLSRISINDTLQTIEALFGLDSLLQLDYATDVWGIGDVSNFTKPVIDSAFNTGGNIFINQYIQDTTGNAFVNFDIATNDVTLLSRMRSDVSNGTDRTIFEQQSDTLFFRFNNLDKFLIDLVNNRYSLGDIGIANNGSQILIDDTSRIFAFFDSVGQSIVAGGANFQVDIGDIDNNINKLQLSVEPHLNQVRIDNITNTAGILINGVAGFTGTVTPVNSITVDAGIVTNVT